MNRTTLQTLIGCVLGLVLGASAAFVGPQISSSSPAPHPVAPSATSVPESDTQIDGPLATAYRAATGAKRWLLLVSAAEHATAAEMSTLIRMARDDQAAVRMLAAHWAELDPAGMFSSLYADFLLPESMPGTLPSRYTLSQVLFEYWAKADLPAAMKALNDAPNFSQRDNTRMNLVNQVMKSDPEAGLRLMSEWNIRNYSPDMKGIAEWAARDPQHAAEAVLKWNAGYASQEALRQVGKAWGKSDPPGALRFAASLDPQKRTQFSTEVIRNWAGADLEAAAAFAAAQTDMSFRNSLATGLVETWGKTDPAAALAWSQENLKGNARTEAIAEVIKAAASKSLTTASQLVADMEPGTVQNRACASIFEIWFAKGAKEPKEREAAFEWLASLPDPAARTAAFEKVQWNWMWNEPDSVRDFIAGPHGDLASQNMINQVARNQVAKNPEAALKWANSLSEARAPEARRSVLEYWLQIRPEAAADYTRTLPAGPDRDSAIRTVSQSLMWQAAPDQAAAWFRSLPASDLSIVREMLDQNRFPADKRQQIEEAIKKS
jgi:hypothetical protein